MNRFHLRIFVYESQKIDEIPVYEWLLQSANAMGIEGGTVFRSIASFGKSRIVHEEHFFEFGADLTLEVSLVITNEQKKQFIELLKTHEVRSFFIISEVECGYT